LPPPYGFTGAGLIWLESFFMIPFFRAFSTLPLFFAFSVPVGTTGVITGSFTGNVIFSYPFAFLLLPIARYIAQMPLC